MCKTFSYTPRVFACVRARPRADKGRIFAPLDPTRAQAWSNLGIACLTMGKFPEGERAFTRRIELVPGDANAWTGRGACRLQQGQVEPAVADLEKALELDPTNDRALGILRQLGRR